MWQRVNKDFLIVSDMQAPTKQYYCKSFSHSLNIVMTTSCVKTSNHGVQ
jgi:hypothetical protein